MNDQWLDFAIRIQSIAQAGLQYGKDKYDKERYNELRKNRGNSGGGTFQPTNHTSMGK